MKSQYQQQYEPQLNYSQYFFYQQLAKIQGLKTNNKNKAKIIAGMICLLKQKEQLDKVKAQQNISTSFSQEQSNFTVYQREIQDLQDRILQKRAIKFQINEEIQGVQEDLFQTEKTVDSKKQYDQKLRKHIQNKMKKIQRLDEEKPQQQNQSYLNKSLKAVTGIFKNWLY